MAKSRGKRVTNGKAVLKSAKASGKIKGSMSGKTKQVRIQPNMPNC